MNIYLLQFNNYYNRQSKYFSTIDEYPEKLDVFTNINFNPNDGVQTELIINYWGPEPDYLLAEDIDGSFTRWFVLEAVRTRAQQYKLSLLRDLVADFREPILNAPCFIEKATLPLSSPFIFNKENFAVNQIKQSETLLADHTGCPWIVGYYAKNTPNENLKGVVEANDLDKGYNIELSAPINAWEFNATANPFYGNVSSIEYRVYFKDYVGGLQSQPAYLSFDRYGNFKALMYVDSSDTSLDTDSAYNTSQPKGDIQTGFTAQSTNMYNQLKSYITINSDEKVENFLSYNGLTVKDSEGKYFLVAIYDNGEATDTVNIESGVLYNTMNNIIKTAQNISGQANIHTYKAIVKRPRYSMSLTELTGLETSWDMTGDKLITEDSPYNIFAIPYGKTTLKYWMNDLSYSNEVMGLATANSIIRTMDQYLYDIQLLPYCPIPNTVEEKGVLYVHDTESYSVVSQPSDVPTANDRPSYILHVPKAKFTKDLKYSIPAPTTAIDAKIQNECKMYRLCSPNYNGAFEFSAAKNNGVAYFNVDCEYKPFQPYIHVNPNFGGLYGQDFNDARGLICGGDFSLTQVEDKWQEYQIQNKNYQQMFDRQIENLEVQHDIQSAQAIASMIAGVGQGVAAGALTGSMLPIGGLAGAGIGAAASLVGGIADIGLMKRQQAETLDYTRDLYAMQLDNIKALPYTLTKVSSFNNNNKIFPFLEYYSCTDEEELAFKNKLKYNGMSVGAIGTITQYLTSEETYIKGKLIRFEIDGDFHIATMIAEEINKGVFIKS